MKYLSLLVLFTCLSIQFGFSQVKKQYLDNKNTASTVVVKEDAANDMQILNSQFDISSFGMGQEIRITTEKTPPVKPTAEVPLAEVPLAEVTPKGAEVTPKKVTPKPAVKKIVKKSAAKPKSTKAARTSTVKKKPTEVYYKGVGKARKRNLKKKKLKLVKRKKVKKRKKRKVRCFSF